VTNGLWGTLAISLLSGLMLGLMCLGMGRFLRWLAPLKEIDGPALSAEGAQQADQALKRLLVLEVTFGILAAVLIFWLSRSLMRWNLTDDATQALVIPGIFWFIVPAMFLGACLGDIVSRRRARRNMGAAQLAAVERLGDERMGYAATRLSALIVWPLMLVSIAWFGAVSDWYLRLSPTHLHISNPFGADPSPIPYSQIRRITIYEKGARIETEPKPFGYVTKEIYLVVFGGEPDDYWTSYQLGRAKDVASQMERLSQLSGVKIERVARSEKD